MLRLITMNSKLKTLLATMVTVDRVMTRTPTTQELEPTILMLTTTPTIRTMLRTRIFEK